MNINPRFINERRTICEVLRDIHRTADAIRSLTTKDDPGDRQARRVQELVEEAYAMAKSMDARLRRYHNDAVRRERTESR